MKIVTKYSKQEGRGKSETNRKVLGGNLEELLGEIKKKTSEREEYFKTSSRRKDPSEWNRYCYGK